VFPAFCADGADHTGGLLVGVAVDPADIQGRDGAALMIEAIHDLFPWLRHLCADSVFNGPNLHDTLAKFGNWTRRWATYSYWRSDWIIVKRRVAQNRRV